jgi:hypothetical protein
LGLARIGSEWRNRAAFSHGCDEIRGCLERDGRTELDPQLRCGGTVLGVSPPRTLLGRRARRAARGARRERDGGASALREMPSDRAA